MKLGLSIELRTLSRHLSIAGLEGRAFDDDDESRLGSRRLLSCRASKVRTGVEWLPLLRGVRSASKSLAGAPTCTLLPAVCVLFAGDEWLLPVDEVESAVCDGCRFCCCCCCCIICSIFLSLCSSCWTCCLLSICTTDQPCHFRCLFSVHTSSRALSVAVPLRRHTQSSASHRWSMSATFCHSASSSHCSGDRLAAASARPWCLTQVSLRYEIYEHVRDGPLNNIPSRYRCHAAVQMQGRCCRWLAHWRKAGVTCRALGSEHRLGFCSCRSKCKRKASLGLRIVPRWTTNSVCVTGRDRRFASGRTCARGGRIGGMLLMKNERGSRTRIAPGRSGQLLK